MATFFGYDPGGDGAHGAARLDVDPATGLVRSVEARLLRTAGQFLEYFSGGCGPEAIAGLGVDTLTEWSLGPKGWRRADVWLRTTYPRVAPSVVSSNSMYGAMCVNGMSVVHVLRHRAPGLLVTETHPKVLYFALSGSKYDWAGSRVAMVRWLGGLLGQPTLAMASDDEFDAVLSAWACWQGASGRWTRDLHAVGDSEGEAEEVVRPAGPTRYFWP
ncbi:MAG: DUF429 domain-containing protein [Deltaproteobacteria bacterium]|nr:DUF429 domain-containing protein [Deltaproteobacteria bacterium]